MKKKLIVFHPAIAPYRVDFFNSIDEIFDAKFYFEFDNALEQTFDQKRLQEYLSSAYAFSSRQSYIYLLFQST